MGQSMVDPTWFTVPTYLLPLSIRGRQAWAKRVCKVSLHAMEEGNVCQTAYKEVTLSVGFQTPSLYTHPSFSQHLPLSFTETQTHKRNKRLATLKSLLLDRLP